MVCNDQSHPVKQKYISLTLLHLNWPEYPILLVVLSILVYFPWIIRCRISFSRIHLYFFLLLTVFLRRWNSSKIFEITIMLIFQKDIIQTRNQFWIGSTSFSWKPLKFKTFTYRNLTMKSKLIRLRTLLYQLMVWPF